MGIDENTYVYVLKTPELPELLEPLEPIEPRTRRTPLLEPRTPRTSRIPNSSNLSNPRTPNPEPLQPLKPSISSLRNPSHEIITNAPLTTARINNALAERRNPLPGSSSLCKSKTMGSSTTLSGNTKVPRATGSCKALAPTRLVASAATE
ncbi:hypothetical protein BGZ61DRAFT_531624 [Ilyonectria robusta]|uniref:uncharacterized protein n=1 Tax=Ilyonectria robusta TaxID=1079257 RepID=UPI001E8DA7BE|nr:uncharacterized protein BGZ61DRAFT_531624 [Ilyonectria robusta]KAH8706436.1 hypothetical protein BGZ61DRAFT_531624 [Ilyonectria robusta]